MIKPFVFLFILLITSLNLSSQNLSGQTLSETTFTDSVTGQKTVVIKRCFSHKKIKTPYEDFTTNIKVYDKDNNLLQFGVYHKSYGVSRKTKELRYLSRYLDKNHRIVASQKNRDKIKLTEYRFQKEIQTKEVSEEELYWIEFFDHYNSICSN